MLSQIMNILQSTSSWLHPIKNREEIELKKVVAPKKLDYKISFKSYPIFEMDQIKVRCLILELGKEWMKKHKKKPKKIVKTKKSVKKWWKVIEKDISKDWQIDGQKTGREY